MYFFFVKTNTIIQRNCYWLYFEYVNIYIFFAFLECFKSIFYLVFCVLAVSEAETTAETAGCDDDEDGINDDIYKINPPINKTSTTIAIIIHKIFFYKHKIIITINLWYINCAY